MNLHCIADKRECCLELVAKIAEISRLALSERGYFSIVLSGGRTPAYLYKLLASKEFADTVVWSRAHIFFGDERCVSPDHQDSNYKMANETLLSKLPILEEQVHRIHGEKNPQDEAIRYEEVIRDNLGRITPAKPAFDLVLLGLGSDGHTASLFPGDAALQSNKLVTPVKSPQTMLPAVERISLTLEGIHLSQNICFLVDGESKSDVVQEVLAGDNLHYPASMVHQKTLSWYISGMDCIKFSKYNFD